MVAYTSGATGRPKGVVYTDQMIVSLLGVLEGQFGLEAEKKDLPLLPMFSLFNVVLGVCSVFPPVDPTKPLSLDPAKVLKVIQDFQVNYSFGSPTLWNKIAEYCVRSRKQLSSISKIFIAGAPVPPNTLERLKEVMPGGESYTPYGATEALPVTLVSGTSLLNKKRELAKSGEEGTLVGKPVKGVEAQVIEASDQVIADISDAKPLAAYQIGELIVKGGNISPRYFDQIDATENAKIKDKDGFWHRMGDMAYLDKTGNIYFCGRKAHIVKVDQKIYYSVPIERIFNQHDKVYRSALIALIGGSEVAMAIEPYPQYFPGTATERAEFISELLDLALSSKLSQVIKDFYFFESFPVDARHNAKIFRDKLGKLAAERSSLQSAA